MHLLQAEGWHQGPWDATAVSAAQSPGNRETFTTPVRSGPYPFSHKVLLSAA